MLCGRVFAITFILNILESCSIIKDRWTKWILSCAGFRVIPCQVIQWVLSLKNLNFFKSSPLIQLIKRRKSWKFDDLIFFHERVMVFVFNFLYDFGCKIKISKKKKRVWTSIVTYLLKWKELRSQFLRMFSRFGWLYGKVNSNIFEKSIKKEMEQNAVFFWNFEQDSIFQPQKAWEREKKKNWNSFF